MAAQLCPYPAARSETTAGRRKKREADCTTLPRHLPCVRHGGDGANRQIHARVDMLEGRTDLRLVFSFYIRH